MSHTVFLAGSTADDMACFADAAKQAGNQVFTADTAKEQGAVAWNKASPISARTALLQAVASYGEVDRAVLYFDAGAFDGAYDKLTVENISRGLDDMIAGFQYMTEEFVNRYAQKADQTGSWLFFVDCCSTSETGVLATAGEAAFKAFAEKTAEQFAGANLKITLVRCDDATITDTADWLTSYWELPAAEKAASQAKTATHWVKTGGKPPLGFLGR